MLITISGFFGSGGAELGRELSRRLDYKTYDNELMEKAVRESGIDMRRSTMAFYDEDDDGLDDLSGDTYHDALIRLQMDVLPIGKKNMEPIAQNYHSDVLSLYMDSAPISAQRKTIPMIHRKDEIERLRFAQAKVVLDAAEQGNAIFFGRCSSYILGQRDDALRIFTYASLDSCRERIRQHFDIQDDDKLDELIWKTNTRRGIYFETFTGQKWDDLKNYDLCLNTDALSFDGALALILNAIETKS